MSLELIAVKSRFSTLVLHVYWFHQIKISYLPISCFLLHHENSTWIAALKSIFSIKYSWKDFNQLCDNMKINTYFLSKIWDCGCIEGIKAGLHWRKIMDSVAQDWFFVPVYFQAVKEETEHFLQKCNNLFSKFN